uniref:Uncharacterized protein n=1 Tax=Oryza rufipogon TaxID=4529 RepID=A0A0E0P7U3_ORYRU
MHSSTVPRSLVLSAACLPPFKLDRDVKYSRLLWLRGSNCRGELCKEASDYNVLLLRRATLSQTMLSGDADQISAQKGQGGNLKDAEVSDVPAFF